MYPHAARTAWALAAIDVVFHLPDRFLSWCLLSAYHLALVHATTPLVLCQPLDDIRVRRIHVLVVYQDADILWV